VDIIYFLTRQVPRQLRAVVAQLERKRPTVMAPNELPTQTLQTGRFFMSDDGENKKAFAMAA